MNRCSSSDAFVKKVFSFTSNDRASLDKISIGSEVSISVRNKKNELVTITFSVTRDAHLGTKVRWVYGAVLNSPDGEYRQIEIKINKNEPEMDTIEVFLQAPPSTTNKLR